MFKTKNLDLATSRVEYVDSMLETQNLDSAASGLENLDSTPAQPKNLELVNTLGSSLKPVLQTFDLNNKSNASKIKIIENPEILESNVFGRLQEQVIGTLEILATLRSLKLLK